MKQWLTTGEISKALSVATRTVTGWIDSGRLKGVRIPSVSPTSKARGDRRVYRDDFAAFCREYGFRLNGEFRDKPIILTLGLSVSPDGMEIVEASSVFEAGILTEQLRPDLIAIDWASIGRLEAAQIARAFREPMKYQPILIGAIANSELSSEVFAAGFHGIMTPPILAESFKGFLMVTHK